MNNTLYLDYTSTYQFYSYRYIGITWYISFPNKKKVRSFYQIILKPNLDLQKKIHLHLIYPDDENTSCLNPCITQTLIAFFDPPVLHPRFVLQKVEKVWSEKVEMGENQYKARRLARKARRRTLIPG